jgi:hypothetical protein
MNPASNGIVRLLLGLVSGALVTAGWLSPEGVESFITMGEYVLGGLVAIGTGAWTLYAKRAASAEAKQIAAKVIVADVPIAAEIAAEKEK